MTDPGPDYTLRWPREAFAREVQEVVLTEATLSKEVWTSRYFGRLLPMRPGLRGPWQFLKALIESAPNLPEAAHWQPYYPDKNGRPLETDTPTDPVEVRREWRQMVTPMQTSGYLSHVAPDRCVNGDRYDPEPDLALDGAIFDRLGVRGLWAVAWPQDWDESTLYGLIEVLHDLMELPRTREMHTRCGYHYRDFAIATGRALYRWRVNQILANHHLGVALACKGENTGRLVPLFNSDHMVRQKRSHPTRDSQDRSTTPGQPTMDAARLVDVTGAAELTWDRCVNVRDLGGLGRVRPRAVVRMEAPTRLTEAGWTTVWAYGVRTVLDLRNPDEISPSGVPRPAGIKTVEVPQDPIGTPFYEHWTAIDNLASPLYFPAMLTEHPGPVIAAVRAIANADPGCVAFHCAGGKDRTGLLALVLLSLAGATPWDVIADYLLSYERMEERYAAMGAGDQLAKVNKLLGRHGTTVERSLTSTIASLTMPDYLLDNGLTQDELARLLDRLVD